MWPRNPEEQASGTAEDAGRGPVPEWRPAWASGPLPEAETSGAGRWVNRGAPCQIQDLGAPGHLAETSIRPLGPRGLELRREFLGCKYRF